MGKKNNGSIGQQNKQLMKEICSEWNSKYRQEMRDDVYGKICHLAENDILYYRRKDGKAKLDGNMIAKMEMQSSTLYLYDNVFVQRENGEYMGVIPYAFELAYQFLHAQYWSLPQETTKRLLIHAGLWRKAFSDRTVP